MMQGALWAQMGAALAKFRGVTNVPLQLDLLRSLAQEIALVAEAAQEGCNAHVVGRAHLKCAYAPTDRLRHKFIDFNSEM